MGVAHLDQEAMDFFKNRSPEDPAVIADARIKEYAEQAGGLTLQYWKLKLGRIWGDPIMMTDDEVAKRLNLPIADLRKVSDETMESCGFNTGGGSCTPKN